MIRLSNKYVGKLGSRSQVFLALLTISTGTKIIGRMNRDWLAESLIVIRRTTVASRSTHTIGRECAHLGLIELALAGRGTGT